MIHSSTGHPSLLSQNSQVKLRSLVRVPLSTRFWAKSTSRRPTRGPSKASKQPTSPAWQAASLVLALFPLPKMPTSQCCVRETTIIIVIVAREWKNSNAQRRPKHSNLCWQLCTLLVDNAMSVTTQMNLREHWLCWLEFLCSIRKPMLWTAVSWSSLISTPFILLLMSVVRGCITPPSHWLQAVAKKNQPWRKPKSKRKHKKVWTHTQRCTVM